jgi:hypothetical protein
MAEVAKEEMEPPAKVRKPRWCRFAFPVSTLFPSWFSILILNIHINNVFEIRLLIVCCGVAEKSFLFPIARQVE